MNNVISEEQLEIAMRKCARGVTYKSSVAWFLLNSTDTIPKLHDQLESGAYRARKPKRFKVTFPKERDLVSICFRDRVFQRSFNDNEAYPLMTKGFILDNWACQKGKGTDRARERLKSFMQDYWHKNGTEGYALKMDIRKYYDSIPHDKAKVLFKKHLSPWGYEQACQIIDHQYPGERGFNPGSQLIQILGISFLNDIDHAMKEKHHAHYYLRYQDDTIILHKSREVLEAIEKATEEMLSEIGLELNRKKTRIVRLADGFDFLGFHYRLSKTGKVVMSVCTDKVRQERRHLRGIARKVKSGELPRWKADEHFHSVIKHYEKGDSARLIMRMQAFYKNLWEEDNENDSKRNPRQETPRTQTGHLGC